jgi:hypothetical protein
MSGTPWLVSGVPVRTSQRAARRGQGQAALAYALEREQLVGQFLQPVGGPAQNQDLETVVAVEVDMGRRHYLGVGVVLQVHQAVGKVRLVVPVHVGEHADGRAAAALELGLGQPVAHKVADSLGAGPAGLSEQGLEPLEQVRLHRHAEPYRAGFFFDYLSVTYR